MHNSYHNFLHLLATFGTAQPDSSRGSVAEGLHSLVSSTERWHANQFGICVNVAKSPRLSAAVVLAENQGFTDEPPSIGSCLDINSILPTFKSQLKNAVNLPTLQAKLHQFEATRDSEGNKAVFDFHNLGQILANVSDAIQWGANKPYADQALDEVSRGASSMFDALAKVVRSIDFEGVAESLEFASFYSAQEPVGFPSGSDAVDLLGTLAMNINVSRLGVAVEGLSEHVRLQDLGRDLDAIKGNLDLEQLMGVLANLPDAVDFMRAGQLLSDMAGSFSFADIGLVVNSFVTSAGNNLEFCNSA